MAVNVTTLEFADGGHDIVVDLVSTTGTTQYSTGTKIDFQDQGVMLEDVEGVGDVRLVFIPWSNVKAITQGE